MKAAMPWLIGGAAVATVAVLAAGVFNMLRRKQNPRRANVLMRWRVGLQALAVALLVLMMLIFGR
ncbi:MAG TPA: twin transmembrane helix small protein [Alphaproteobacteria bacterium]|nr:twin transmembrane helix small protein [Alphaproteobacteria bacterium]